MTLTLTALYAAPLGLLAIGLSVAVTMLRAKTNILLGDNQDGALLLRIRRHGNFVETVPLALLLMFLAELSGGPALMVHAAGVALVSGRISHMIGLSGEQVTMLRGAGTGLTSLSVLISVVMIVLSAFG